MLPKSGRERWLDRARTLSCRALGLGALALCAACSDGSEAGSAQSEGASAGAGAGGGSAGSSAADGGFSLGSGGSGGLTRGDAGQPSGEGCAAQSAEADLQPVYLGFAFDVSGSMGDNDPEFGDDHDRTLKWDPVVTATTAFFTDPDASGISAALTLFPIDADQDPRCDSGNYTTPDVSMTALPSDAFGSLLESVEPTRGGTPTLAVLSGVIDQLEPLADANPGAEFAVVLVSDGKPQSCDDNSIASIVDEVSAVADRIPTYVIGVANPSGDDNVNNLDEIAVGGGTDQALIVPTGDPEQTQADFKAIIDGIRHQTVSCRLEIPPPPAGQTFDSDKINVTYESAASGTDLGHDADCTTDDAWRYDDPSAPTLIELCPTTCSTVQADESATLSVEFGCKRRDNVE